MSLTIVDYHFHLYYDEKTIEIAKSVAEKLSQLYTVKFYTFHQKSVGPHPLWSVQISIPLNKFSDCFQWLIINHQGLSVFCHPNTGNNFLDHTEHAFWIGQSVKIRANIFKPE